MDKAQADRHDRLMAHHAISSPGLARDIAGPPIEEFDLVRLRTPLREDEVELPAGSVGTVVHVYANGRGYEVEFQRPLHAVVTVEAAQVERRDG